jgi:hypothetical protein
MVVNLKTFQNIKKTHIVVAAILVLSLITSMIVARNAYAAALTQVMVRFDRMQTSTATTGTVCAKPATVGTETTVKVSFPTGYTVSTTAGNWTVNTTNTGWPSGGTAWLGIGTASTAVAQDVTFPSSDLVVGTLYCFNWTNTAAVSTASGASNTNTGTVTTQATGPATIDASTFVTSTIADDTIDVTATVPQAFSFALSGVTDALGTLSTGSVTTSPTPRTVTVNTNAKNGWLVWAKDNFGGLCAASVGTCTANAQTTQLNTTATGSNRTLSAGTSDVNFGITQTQTSGGTVTVAAAFVGTAAGQGGGLSSTALQTLVSSDGPANNAVLTMKYNAAIDGIEAAATDYTDTVTVVGAGLF